MDVIEKDCKRASDELGFATKVFVANVFAIGIVIGSIIGFLLNGIRGATKFGGIGGLLAVFWAAILWNTYLEVSDKPGYPTKAFTRIALAILIIIALAWRPEEIFKAWLLTAMLMAILAVLALFISLMALFIRLMIAIGKALLGIRKRP